MDVAYDVPDDLRVDVDPDRFEQMLVNLLTTAVRYGAEPVKVTAEPGPAGEVRVAVRDHGPGIPDQTRAHGARVTYENADPGARFVITLPAMTGEPSLTAS